MQHGWHIVSSIQKIVFLSVSVGLWHLGIQLQLDWQVTSCRRQTDVEERQGAGGGVGRLADDWPVRMMSCHPAKCRHFSRKLKSLLERENAREILLLLLYIYIYIYIWQICQRANGRWLIASRNRIKCITPEQMNGPNARHGAPC